MKYSVFGKDFNINDNSTIDFEFDQRKIGKLSRSNETFIISVEEAILISSTENKISIDKGAVIKLDEITHKGTFTGNININVTGIQLPVDPIISVGNTVLFAQKSDPLNRNAYNLGYGNHFDSFSNLSLSPDDMDISGIIPNIALNCTDLFFGKTRFLVHDTIVIEGDPFDEVSFDQHFSVDLLRLNTTTTTFISSAELGHFLIHPDVFDIQDNIINKRDKCSIKYQFAFANGKLCLEKSEAVPGKLFWNGFKATDSPCLLLLTHNDAHTNPIALLNEDSRFELLFREGHSTLLNPDIPGNYQKTIRGLSPATIENATIRSLNYKTIDWNKKEKQLFGIMLGPNDGKESLTEPFWLGAEKTVILNNTAPKTIYSAVKAAWFEQKNDIVAADAQGSMKVNAVSIGNESIYHFITLDLQAAQWEMMSQYEERESKVFDPTNGNKVFQTDKRRFIHDGVLPTIQLPATDYLLGTSNIVDPAAKESAVIPDEIKRQLKTINKNFSSSYTFVPTNEEHIQGFLRKSDNKNGIKPDSIFFYPAVRSDSIIDTVTLPLQLQHNQLSFSHGDYRQVTKKPLARENAAPNALPDKDVESLLIQFQHIWNDYLDIIDKTADLELKKAAESVRNIRRFLENMQDEHEQTKLRVRIKDELFYRLRFDKLAPSAENKEMILQQIKRFVYGNINAIPGLGKKINNLSVKVEVDNLTVAALEQKWNTAWSDLNNETDKTLYLLFDFVYKQFDRAILNKLITIALAAEGKFGTVDQDIKTVIEYLRPGIDVKRLVGDLRDNVDANINELLSSVSQGADPYFKKVQEIWEGVTDLCPGITPDFMHHTYGPHFDISTFKTILKDLKSNEPVIREQANKIIHCLENKLKQKIKEELLTAWNEEAGKPWAEIEHWFTKVFDAYEEDIRAFYDFIVRLQAAKAKIDVYIAFVRILSKVKNAGDLKTLIADPAFKPVFNEISDVIKAHYQEDLKHIEQLTTDQLNAMIDEHWDKIVVAAEVIEMLTDEFAAWQLLIIDLQKAVDDVRFKVTQFIGNLHDDNKQKTFLRIFISYLIEKYQVHISIPDLRVDPPQYIVYSKHLSFNADSTFSAQLQNLLNLLHRIKLPLCSFGSDKTWNYSLTEFSIYILKLGNDMDFDSILTEINNNNKKPGLEQGPFDDRVGTAGSPLANLISDLHPEINTKSWRGLLILKPFADIRNDTLLADIVGKSSLQMIYAAIGGTKYPLGDSSFNVYARIKEEAQKMDVQLGDPADLSKQPDAHFTLIKFDALIKNTKLESGDALLQLDFKNLFGKTPGDGPDKFRSVFIRGSVPVKPPGDNSPRDFEFAVTFHPEVVFDNLLGFIKSLQLRGIKASKQAGRSVLEIDGTLIFKPFSVIVNVKQLALRNFYVVLPASDGVENPAGKPRGVNFDIGAIEFNIDIPRPINLYGLELIPKGIGFIKKAGQGIIDGLNRTMLWIKENGPALDLSFTYFKIDIQFGKLPSLGGTNLQDLKLDGLIGFKIKDGNIEGGPHFGINGISASELSIDLFRFISLHIKNLLVRNAFIGDGENPVTFMGAQSIDLKILDWSPLGKDGNLSLAFIHNNPPDGSSGATKTPQTGMIAAYSNREGLSLGVLKLYWILLAHNIQFSKDILLKLISPASLNSGDDDAMTAMMTGIFEGIRNADDDHHFKDIDFTDKQSWLFGASFAVANVLDRCSFILHDQYFYGVLLSSTQAWFKELFGTDTLSLAYIPGATKQQDRFRIETKLPFLDLIGNLQSGLTALEYGLNRDFLVDFGFPWKSGNTYLWDRTFSFASGIYETRFGFYFEKRTDVTLTGDKLLTIGAGVALSYGYRVGARTVVAYAEAGISVFVILMGTVTFRFPEGTSPTNILKGTIYKIEVIGVIGIYAYARGGINYWVLTAEIRAEVVAALAGVLIYMPQGNSSLTFSATLSVRYAASCRVKIGFVKISFSVSGSLGYGVAGRIALN